MDPSIQYATSPDSASIAYWTFGEGKPLLEMPALDVSHVQQEWQVPPLRRLYERLAERRMLIRYDGRGSGLSQRGSLKVLGERFLELQCDAAPHDTNAIDRVDQRVGIRFEDVPSSVLDHYSLASS